MPARPRVAGAVRSFPVLGVAAAALKLITFPTTCRCGISVRGSKQSGLFTLRPGQVVNLSSVSTFIPAISDDPLIR